MTAPFEMCSASGARPAADGTVGAGAGAFICAMAYLPLTPSAHPSARPRRELGAVVEPELGEDVTDVNLDGPDREVKSRGDRLVRESLGDQPRNFELSSAQAARSWGSRLPGSERERDGVVDVEAPTLFPQPIGIS